MALKYTLYWLIIVNMALCAIQPASAQQHIYRDNHADDPDIPLPKSTGPKPPPAPPLVIDGKTLIKPKKVMEIPFHLNPYQSMRQAEYSEKNVRTEIGKIEANYPNAVYMVTFYLPIYREGPMKLPRDPNIYLSAILNEIKELKVPSKRVRSTVEYVNLLRQPRIIIYCYVC